MYFWKLNIETMDNEEMKAKHEWVKEEDKKAKTKKAS